MNLRLFLTISAALGAGYGVAFLLLPGFVGRIYGVPPDPSTLLAYRYFGVALLASGLYAWAVRDSTDAALMRTFLLAFAVSNIAGVAVSAYGASSGQLNAMGWFNVLLYASMLAGCVFFLRAPARTAYRAT